jgi:hypothetical protein
MVRVNADYIRFVHGDAARLGHRPAMRLIDLASERQKPVCWSCGEKDDIRIINRVTAVCRSCGTGIGSDKDRLITVDLHDDDMRHELLTGAEAYSANAYSDRSLARTAQRLFQNIHKWEHQHEERDHGYTDDKAEG